MPLQRALVLSEQEGYVRIFVDEGSPMAVLPQAAARQGIAPDYSRQLLAALGPAPAGPPAKQALNTHTKNIYAKLGANNRGAAVRRAMELQLF